MNKKLPAPPTEVSTWIDAPPEDVWNCVATIHNLSRQSPETTKKHDLEIVARDGGL